jgi:hypothetical protein
MTNPIIDKARQALLAKIDPRLTPVVAKVVDAGKQVMYSDQTRDMAIQQLKQGSDPESVGAAVAKLAAILFNQSKHTIPMNVLLPATMMLLFEALEFLEEAGTLKIDQEQLAAYCQATGSAFLQMLGVTPEKLQGLIGQAAQNAPAGPAAEPPAAPQPGGIVAGA